MDLNTQNSSGMMNGMPPVPKPEKKVGPIIGVLVIVIIIIAVSLYIFGKGLNTNSSPELENSAQTSQSVIEQDSLTATATNSDNIEALRADLDIQLENVDYSF